MTLENTKYGYSQKLIIGGLNTFDVFNKSLNVVYYIEILDENGIKADDPTINQNRRVMYNVNNDNKVNAQFNKVETGGVGEYDYFWDKLQTIPLPTLVLQLSEKLKERGIFN